MKPGESEPGSDPIISDGAARFTVALFLALFTLGVALLIWRGLSSVPEGDHRIDQVMGALHTFSTFAIILLVLYLALAARIAAQRQGELLRLRFQEGLTEGWKQATRQFGQDAPETWQS